MNSVIVTSCTYELFEGSFVDGLWGDASLVGSIAEFAIKEGTRFSIGRLPFGNWALKTAGYDTTEDKLAPKFKECTLTFLRLKDYLGTEEGYDLIQQAYCYQTNQNYKRNFEIVKKIYNEIVNVSQI